MVFVGLTDETASELPEVQRFIDDTGITWLNGYGAGETLEEFGHAYNPQRWLIGRDRRIAWNESSSESLEEAIEAALGEEAAGEQQAAADGR